VFPPHPTTISSSQRVECVLCDPDALGMADLRRQFDRKQEDPALAPFLNLVHPLEDVHLDIHTQELPDA
jgi:hypothetical protein